MSLRGTSPKVHIVVLTPTTNKLYSIRDGETARTIYEKKNPFFSMALSDEDDFKLITKIIKLVSFTTIVDENNNKIGLEYSDSAECSQDTYNHITYGNLGWGGMD